MKIILLIFVLVISVLTTIAQQKCSLTEDPKKILECVEYITLGLYGAVFQDLNRLCRVASDVARCSKDKIYDCVASEVGEAILEEVTTLATYCCPTRDNKRCPIGDSIIKEQRCFAADSLVTLSNGNQKSIVDLHSGDVVLAYDDKTKKIISTHIITMLDFQPHQFALFKEVTTITGRQLSLTSSHLLPTDRYGYVMAKNIHIGMNIYVMNDDGILISETISNVSDVVKQGYIAPLTEEGTLIVNNVAASCYATINSHYAAHAVLAPMRWWYNLFGISKESKEMIGVHWFPKMLYEMTTFLMPSIIDK